jgi:hypothetical protein
MKIICVSILTLFLSVAAQADPDVRTLNTTITCVSLKALSETIEEYKEVAALNMTHTREIKGQMVELPTVLFVNYKTKTWTLAEQITKDFYCILGSGNDIAPVVPKDTW